MVAIATIVATVAIVVIVARLQDYKVTIVSMVQASGKRLREQGISHPETSHPDDSPPKAEERRELVFNDDYQRVGIQIIPTN